MPKLNSSVHLQPPSILQAKVAQVNSQKTEAQSVPQATHKMDDIFDEKVLKDLKMGKTEPNVMNFEQKPGDYTHVKLQKSDTSKATITPGSEPGKYMLTGKGGHLTLTMGKADLTLDGVSLSTWPPEKATFTDPDSGKITEGYRLIFSSGDEAFVPKGVEVNINNKGAASQFNQPASYIIPADGSEPRQNEMHRLRYASVFALR